MTNSTYDTRKEQIEQGFMRTLSRDLKACGFPLTRRAKNLIKEELRSAAMVGASEERFRTMKIVRAMGASPSIDSEITKLPVLKVLGYE